MEILKSTAKALKLARRPVPQPSSPRPRPTTSLMRYVREFESGAANPHGIRVRIRLHGVGEFDRPLQLARNGRLPKPKASKRSAKS